jgi:hypothetical protein
LTGSLDIFLVALVTLVAARMNLAGSKPHRRSMLLLFATVSFLTCIKLVTNTAKENISLPIAIALFVWFLRTGKLPIKPIALSLAAFIIFAPISAFLRNDADIIASQTIKFSDYSRIASFVLDQILNDKKFVINIFGSVFGRLDLVGTSAALINSVQEGRVPLSNGTSFVLFFFAFIPRILLPFKPINTEFYDAPYLARATGVIPMDNIYTSVAFGPAAELYMNFKIAAVILGMFLIGYLVRSFYELLVQQLELSDLAILAMSFPLYSIFFSYMDSFSALAGAIPTSIFSILIVAIISYLVPTFNYENSNETASSLVS